MSPHTLKERLNRKAQHLPADDLLKKMGYSHPDEASRERLERALASETLGLEGDDYDLKYDSRGFIRALCDALGIDFAEHESEVEAIRQAIVDEQKAFQPSLSLVTNELEERPGFLRSMRATASQKGSLKMSWESRLASREAVIEEASELARSHYQANKGEVDLWGSIPGYVLLISPDDRVYLTPDGRISEVRI